MGLKGQLEDLPLLDMLQIIAFSKKSGYLRVAGPPGRGAVVLREGRILFAYSWSTVTGLRELVEHRDRITPELVREQIETSLRELAGLRDGSFEFELDENLAEEIGGLNVKPLILENGLDPQELLLDLAVEIDNERREATSLLELAFQGDDLPPEEPDGIEDDVAELATMSTEEERTSMMEAVEAAPVEGPVVAAPVRAGDFAVVVVDDEAPVTDVVGRELQKRGYRVFTAQTPGEGADLVRARARNGEHVLAVVDLKMPTTSGKSFYGGFELIRRLEKQSGNCPILLMVESLSEKARARAKELGVRRLVYKPTLTKPDPELYRADLRDFAGSIHEGLQKLIEDTSGEGPVAEGVSARDDFGDTDRMSFLTTMTRELIAPGGSADVSRLVLEVAQKFLERGVLFVVKSETARGLAAYGIGPDAGTCSERARSLSVDIAGSEPFTRVVSTGTTVRVADPSALDDALYRHLGRGKAREAVLMPMLYNRATLLMLFGDNAASGSPLGDLGGLELFMAQAGMALENKLLQRKLDSTEVAAADIHHGGQTRLAEK